MYSAVPGLRTIATRQRHRKRFHFHRTARLLPPHRWHGISQAPSLWAWFGVRRWDLALVLERRRSAKAALEAEEVRAGEEAASESEIDARSQPKGPIGVGSALAAARARRASARKSVDSDGSDGDT